MNKSDRKILSNQDHFCVILGGSIRKTAFEFSGIQNITYLNKEEQNVETSVGYELNMEIAKEMHDFY